MNLLNKIRYIFASKKLEKGHHNIIHWPIGMIVLMSNL